MDKQKPYIVITPLIFLLCALLVAPPPALAVSLQEEIKLGQDIDKQILGQVHLSTDKAAIEEMNKLGLQLAKGVKRTDIEYHFRILDEGDQLDAFSIPGGYVYLSQRMWNILRPDEREGVLAHEITHVDGRHALDAISKQRKRFLLTNILLMVVGANQSWADVAGLANNLYTLKYSRGDEEQADVGAVELAKRASMNPAGILLAMRKIMRFQDEIGGQPPKLFSTHPPTKERIAKLERLLQSEGVPVPPEDVKTIDNPNKIGETTSVNGNTIQFTSSKPLANSDIIWVMMPGWDYRFENHTFVPVARGIVQKSGVTNTAVLWRMPVARETKFSKGMDVFLLPSPEPVDGAGMIEFIGGGGGDVGRLVSESPLRKLDRFLALQTVWNGKDDRVEWKNIGYIVVTSPDTRGYVAASNPDYSYAPIGANSILVQLDDPDANRWIGSIISIGRGGETIEILPSRQLERDRDYDVLYPAWDSKDIYKDRLVGKARLQSIGSKVVLKMKSYTLGWDIGRIGNSYDIYEETQQKITP